MANAHHSTKTMQEIAAPQETAMVAAGRGMSRRQASRASSAACPKVKGKGPSESFTAWDVWLRHVFFNIFEQRLRAAPESGTSPNHHGPEKVAHSQTKCLVIGIWRCCLRQAMAAMAPTFWESATVCDSMMLFRGDAVHGRD